MGKPSKNARYVTQRPDGSWYSQYRVNDRHVINGEEKTVEGPDPASNKLIDKIEKNKKFDSVLERAKGLAKQLKSR